MTKEAIGQLLERYLAGECSPDELQVIDNWFDQREQQSPLTAADTRRLADEMLAAIKHHTVLHESRLMPRIRRIWWRSAAAAALVLASLGYLFFDQIQQVPSAQRADAPSEFFTYHTLPGQRAKLLLPDSTVIWLNGSTAIRYDKALDGAVREVFLDRGEAFFDVRPDTSRPFLVHANQLVTRVLGTSFNIQLTNDRSAYRLTVSTGKVGVTHRDSLASAAVLAAGQQLVYPHTGDYVVSEVDPTDFSAWTRNELVFRNASWAEVANRLHTWYGVTVALHLREGARETFTARFENPALETVLEALQKINKFQYTINRKEVSITD